MPTPNPDKPKNARRPAASKPVKIVIRGLYSMVESAPTFLLPHLEYRRIVTTEGGPLGYEQHQETQPMGEIDEKGNIFLPTGLLHHVQRLLADHDFPVKIVDERQFDAKPFAVDKRLFQGTEGDDRRLLKAVLEEPMGQIEVQKNADLLEKMRLIIRLYPKARVLILTGSRSLAKKIQAELDEISLDFDVRLKGPESSWPKRLPRCMVSTFGQLQYCPTDQFHMILLPDVTYAVLRQGLEGVFRFHNRFDLKSHRIYSFPKSSLRRGDRDRIVLEAISGGVIFQPSPTHCPVRIRWLTTPDCKKFAECEGLKFKRAAFWHNDQRNDRIAGVARAIAERNEDKLRENRIPLEKIHPGAKIAILVESTEHGREMVKRLPEWAFLHARPEQPKTTAVAETDKEKPPGWIVTMVKAAKTKIDADIVIRATGSTGILAMKDFPPKIDKTQEREVLVIDFKDEFPADAETAAKRRRKEYEMLGWKEI
jgi:hypothetical protein